MIHKFCFDEAKIVVDVHSGAVHVIDDLVWNLLDEVEDFFKGADKVHKIDGDLKSLLINKYKNIYNEANISESIDEIENLINQGLLFSEDKFYPMIQLPEKPILKSLCLHVAHDCNLRCKYCFASSGHFGGERTMMSLEVGKEAIELLIQNSGGRKNLEIDFFGGEPLMNFNVVKELVSYGRKRAEETGKVFKFTLTTNGLLLSPEIEGYLNDNDISVVLSLDGRPEVNDEMRNLVSGKGSYERITPNILRFVNSRNNEGYYVRGTFTRKNLDFSEDVKHIAELGIKHISVEPVVAPPEEDFAFKDEDVAILNNEYEKLTRYFLERKMTTKPFTFFHFNLDLGRGPCLPKRLSGCGAGHEYAAVSPEGELYPCHQFVGKPDFLIGNVFDKEINYELARKFQQAHVYNKEKCNNCWAKFYCSGGCHANAHAFNGDLYKPYDIGCELEKKRLECAIYIQVKEAGLAD